jgi:hypothetical protein
MTSRWVLVFPFVVVSLAGCGESGPKDVPVKGKLVAPGGAAFHDKRPADKPLPPGDPGVRVKFTSLEAGTEPGHPHPSYLANIDPDSATFEVPGPQGKGIPAGKYRVTVYVGPAGENSPPSASPPSGVPPSVGNAGEDNPGLDGKEVSRTEVTVLPEGTTDLTITVGGNKK